jgi:hypothetical protein
MPGKKKEGQERKTRGKEEIGRNIRISEGIAFPSSLSHGGVGLDSFPHYVRPPAKTHEAWVYGGGVA